MRITAFRLSCGAQRRCKVSAGQRRDRRAIRIEALTVFKSDDVVLESYLGSQGILTISSYGGGASLQGLEDVGLSAVQQLGKQQLDEEDITVRLYSGRIARGELSGTRVICKAYPRASLPGADAMAATEVAAHGALQPPSSGQQSPYIVELLGGFQVTSGVNAGEQWLVFTDSGVISAAQYAQAAALASADGQAVGDAEFWDNFDRSRPLRRRQRFIVAMLRQVLCGLAYMHSRSRLHQSLGPYSVVLDSVDERSPQLLSARLRDLAFSLDVSDSALFGGPTLAEIWERGTMGSKQDVNKQTGEALWRRARSEGARDEISLRNFGLADDIYSAGLLLAYMAFIPFCEPDSIDAPSLQRLLESTFRCDIPAVREYAEADDRWTRAVEFLDVGNRAGWDLLQAMMNPDWRLRPTADSCLKHPFLTGAAFDDAPPIPPGQVKREEAQDT